MCAGTSSIIYSVDLSLVESDDEFVEYIYRLMRVHQKPAVDHNQVLNIIKFLINNSYLEKELANSITEYITIHKKCGLYIYLEPNEKK